MNLYDDSSSKQLIVSNSIRVDCLTSLETGKVQNIPVSLTKANFVWMWKNLDVLPQPGCGHPNAIILTLFKFSV